MPIGEQWALSSLFCLFFFCVPSFEDFAVSFFRVFRFCGGLTFFFFCHENPTEDQAGTLSSSSVPYRVFFFVVEVSLSLSLFQGTAIIVPFWFLVKSPPPPKKKEKNDAAAAAAADTSHWVAWLAPSHFPFFSESFFFLPSTGESRYLGRAPKPL